MGYEPFPFLTSKAENAVHRAFPQLMLAIRSKEQPGKSLTSRNLVRNLSKRMEEAECENKARNVVLVCSGCYLCAHSVGTESFRKLNGRS